MGFQLAVAYGSSLALITVLGMFSAWNRRTGWRRDRTDEVTDVLTLWAEIHRGELQAKQAVPLIPLVSGIQGTVTTDLSTLHLILNAEKVNRPSESRVQTQETEFQETFAEGRGN